LPSRKWNKALMPLEQVRAEPLCEKSLGCIPASVRPGFFFLAAPRPRANSAAAAPRTRGDKKRDFALALSNSWKKTRFEPS